MVESSVWAHADGIITIQWTVYIGNYYERTALVTYDDQTWETLSMVYTTRIYYYAGSTRIAMREIVEQNSTLYWLLTDHRGCKATEADKRHLWRHHHRQLRRELNITGKKANVPLLFPDKSVTDSILTVRTFTVYTQGAGV